MKYVLFGDSFCDPNYYAVDYQKSTMWMNNLDSKAVSYGLKGSSIWYSIEKLMEYTQSNKYTETDRIIFCSTSSHRQIQYKDKKWPEYSNLFPDQDVTGQNYPKDAKKYLVDNQDAHNYIFFNVLSVKLFLQLERLVANYLDRLPNETLLLPGCRMSIMDTMKPKELVKLQKHNKMLKLDPGFDRVSDDAFYLRTVSKLEYIDRSDMALNDLRANHFSPENHLILADLIVEFFKTKDHSIFKVDKFKSKFLTSADVNSIKKKKR